MDRHDATIPVVEFVGSFGVRFLPMATLFGASVDACFGADSGPSRATPEGALPAPDQTLLFVLRSASRPPLEGSRR
jgi:hypothetical protein